MNRRLLVNTDVWVDFFDQTRAGNAAADQFVRCSIERGDILLYSISTAQSLYYAMWAAAKRMLRAMYGELTHPMRSAAEGMAWDCVRSLGEIATCVGSDKSDLWLAEKSHGLRRDLEDDLVIAAAQRIGVHALVTTDGELLRRAPIAALCPADALTYFGGKAEAPTK